ncbi:MAG: glycosyl hydrolase family 18 protein [Rikenellaceae bacterium]
MSTEEKRTNLIETLVEYAQARGFDGIDIDYEEYNTFNLEDLIAFAAQLRESMPQEWLLTCAVAPWLEYDGYAQYFDYINVMSYDDKVTGDTPGAHASMDKFKSDMANTQKWAISDAQIVGGVPFYGWSWEDPSSVLGISYDYVISRFPTAEVADADNYGSLYYNGRNTIREKCVYVKEYGYGGIMIWQMAQDCLNPDFRLLDVIDQEMRNE